MNQLAIKTNLSPGLEKAIRGQKLTLGLSNGAELYFAERWTLPANLSPEIIDEAKALIQSAELENEPAPEKIKAKWLASLGTLCAGKATVSEIQSQLVAYASMIDHPETAFTKTTLDKAARNFKWFPSYAELTDFLDAETSTLRNNLARLRHVANAKPNQRKAGEYDAPTETQAERKSHAKTVMEDLKRKMGENVQNSVINGDKVPLCDDDLLRKNNE